MAHAWRVAQDCPDVRVGLDVERLPWAVWDSQRGLSSGEFVAAACASEETAREVALALEGAR